MQVLILEQQYLVEYHLHNITILSKTNIKDLDTKGNTFALEDSESKFWKSNKFKIGYYILSYNEHIS